MVTVASLMIALAAASATELFQEGEFTAAIAAAQARLAEQPGDTEARIVLGRTQLELGDAAAAAATLREAARLAPDSAETHYRLGQALTAQLPQVNFFRRMSIGSDVGDAFRRAVELAPDNGEYHWALFQFCRHAPPFAGGGRKRTEQELAVLDRLDPARGHRARAVILKEDDKPQAAEAELRAAVEASPGVADHRFALGYFYQQAARWDDAFATFEEIVQRFPGQWQAHFQIGKTASLSGRRIDAGVAALRRYLQHQPRPEEPPLARAHYRLGLLHQKQQDRDAARSEFKAALEMDAGLDEARMALASLERG
jgi:tetratricopeptide (TPR) repeat protein